MNFQANKYKALILSQLRVGALGFGGPLSAMAMMRDELVIKQKFLTEQRYLEGLGVVKLLPGPVSTLMATFLGQECLGWVGGVLSAACFILPSFLLMLLLAWAETVAPLSFLRSPHFLGAMQALQAGVIGLVLYTAWKLFAEASHRHYQGVQRPWAAAGFGVLAACLFFSKLPELLLLLICSILAFLLGRWQKPAPKVLQSSVWMMALLCFWFFFQAGLTVFGTGYMILPYIQRVLVDERAWLSSEDFLRGVAYGNLTPGPITIATTYFGFKMASWPGAFAATIGNFLGPIVLMLMLSPLIKKILGRPWVESVLLGLLPAVAASVALSLIPIAQKIPWNPFLLVLLALSLILSFRRLPAWQLLLLNATLGAMSPWWLR